MHTNVTNKASVRQLMSNRLCKGSVAGCQALSIYKELLAEGDPDPVLYIYAGACLYYMGLYDEAMDMAAQVSNCSAPQLHHVMSLIIPISRLQG